MGALSEIYVATTSGNDGAPGDGTSAHPYKTVQYVLTSTSQDTTNGNYINISGIDTLAATLNFSAWTTHNGVAQLCFRNWIGGPDGQGGMNGNNGNFNIFDGSSYYVRFLGLILYNTGTASAIRLGDACSIQNCEVHTSDLDGIEIISTAIHGANVKGNNVYNIARYGILANAPGNLVYGNYLKNSTKSFVTAIYCGSVGGSNRQVVSNIISVSGASNGIVLANDAGGAAYNNSILSAGGTGRGIDAGDYGDRMSAMMNNLVEGFSGAGGIGMKLASYTTEDNPELLHNAVYNCATAYNQGDQNIFAEDNETLGTSPFAKSGGDTFANRFTYFAPVDTGNVWGGAYPGGNLDKGAVQHAAVAARYMKQSHYRFRRNDGLLQAP